MGIQQQSAKQVSAPGESASKCANGLQVAGNSNLPILAQNTLLGLSETAGILYLKLLDQFEGWSNPANERRAFLTACDYEDRCGSVLGHILTAYPGFSHVAGKTRADLSRFFSERWRHNFMPHLSPTSKELSRD